MNKNIKKTVSKELKKNIRRNTTGKKKDSKAKLIGLSILAVIFAAMFFLGNQDMKDIVYDVIGFDQEVVEKEEPVTSDPHVRKQDSGIIDNGKSSFTAEEQGMTEGSIELGELDHLGRATAANAVLTKEMYKTGSSAKQSIKPTGWISGQEPTRHARGHLIGNQLGGTGEDERNLVTIYQNPVNTPFMTKYENAVKNAIVEGDVVRYRVTPVFDGDELFAREIRMEGKSLTAWGEIDFDVTIPNEQNQE